ncbi:RIP metalloprotease RseP [Devosia sp.]|uniref:RIP metalloprotease RseP n=1 Tax=Devosia sp. TaxID=1871048 RepID=UPI0035B483C4
MDFVFWLFSYVVPFLAVLTIIVFVHEMGHYLVARWNGIAIQTFSIGFGPELVGFNDRHGTRWRISAIPLGGYVRFVGDMNAASAPDPEFIERAGPELSAQLFANKNVWRRIAVVAAGPLANVLFTLLILYALLLGYGRFVAPAVLQEITAESAAELAGLETGDRILSVDGFRVRGFEDFQRLIATAPERQVTITLERDGTERTIVAVPRSETTTDSFGNTHRVGRMGVLNTYAAGDYQIYRPGPIEAIGMTLEEVRFIIDRTVAFLGDFFVGRGDVEQLGGPIKVAQVSQQVSTLGPLALVNLIALLSLNIGLVNLLPIPMLDGGHLAYYLIEAIRGRPLTQRIQEIGFRFGVAVVFTLMVFTLINDLI